DVKYPLPGFYPAGRHAERKRPAALRFARLGSPPDGVYAPPPVWCIVAEECSSSRKKNDNSGFRAPSQARGGMSYTDRRLSAANARRRLQQLDLLFMHSRLSHLLILLASLVVAVLIWSSTSPRLILGWLAAICGLTRLRMCVARLYNHSSAEQRLHRRWPILFYIGNALSGLSLGLTHILLVPIDTFAAQASTYRSEEHTSELQSRENLVCRLLLEKKKK